MPRALFFILWILPQVMIGQVILVDQSSNQVGASIVAQKFESSLSAYDSYTAEDLIVPTGEQWHLDSLLAFGEYASPTGTIVPGSGIIVSLHSDASGLPGGVLFTDTLQSGADPDTNGSLFYFWDEPFVLNPGTYWLVVTARKDYGSAQTQWQWFSSSNTEGDTGLWVNPGGGFILNNCPSWTEVTTCYGSVYPGMSFTLYGCPGPKPSIQGVPSDTSFCANESLTLTANSSANSPSYVWSNGGSTASTTIFEAGGYAITVIDGNSGCASVDSVHVTAIDPPIVSVSDTGTCPGEQIPMSVSTCSSCSVLWSNGSAALDSVMLGAGSHWLMITDYSTFCSAIDSFTISEFEVDSIELSPGLNVFKCPEDTLELMVTNSFSSYLWDDGSTLSSRLFSEAGTFSITTTDEHGCQSSASGTVSEFLLPEVTITYESEVQNESFRIYTVDPFEGYLWSTGDTTSFTIVPWMDVMYYVTVTDSNGCTAFDSIFIITPGLSERESNSHKVFPIPASESFSITRLNHEGKVKMVIRTVDGRVYIQEESSRRRLDINVAHLRSGHYFLIVEEEDTRYTYPLIIE